MMKYLVILISDQSTSYCHYNLNNIKEQDGRLIPLDTLKNAIKYAFMENYFIQFVLPPFPLPKEYDEIITTTKASIIAPLSTLYDANVLVIEGTLELNNTETTNQSTYVLRTNKNDFFKNYNMVIDKLCSIGRLNIVFTDIEDFTDNDLSLYNDILTHFVHHIKNMILSKKEIQLNIITDRLMESEMNNCNAGYNTITVAPDGKFYLCPAFYYAQEQSIGDITNGLNIKNSQLYKLDYAPLCRQCDAFQCKRCIYLNKRLTREVNIPSKEQCVMAHLERNASRLLLEEIRKHINYLKETEIPQISYLDPLDNIVL